MRLVGIERGDLRKVGVIGVAQRGRADDCIEVMDRPPRAFDPIEGIVERRYYGSPCSGARVGCDRFGGSARVRDELIDCGRDMFGADRVETREAAEIE